MKPEALRENIRDITWDHAVNLGVPGHETNSEWNLITDPEAITILAGIHEEPRLLREWAGWLRKFGDKLNNSRLKKMLRALIEFQDDVVATEIPDSEDENLMDKLIDSETVLKELSPVKSLLESVKKRSDHSFGPALEVMANVHSETDKIDMGNAKIDHVKKSKIVPNVPPLLWRNIAGVNARAELIRAVGTGWSGSNKLASRDLYLPETSVRRARLNLEPTNFVTVNQVSNQKVISIGPGHPQSNDTTNEHNFMNWFMWIRVVLKTKPLIDSNLNKELGNSLEKRFSDIAEGILERELLNPTFTHRHGNQAPRFIIDRVLKQDS